MDSRKPWENFLHMNICRFTVTLLCEFTKFEFSVMKGTPLDLGNTYCIFNINITTWTNIISCLTWFWLFAKILPKHKPHGDGQGQHRILGNLSWHKTFFPTINAIKKSLLILSFRYFFKKILNLKEKRTFKQIGYHAQQIIKRKGRLTFSQLLCTGVL